MLLRERALEASREYERPSVGGATHKHAADSTQGGKSQLSSHSHRSRLSADLPRREDHTVVGAIKRK